jgi:hypothetical protein
MESCALHKQLKSNNNVSNNPQGLAGVMTWSIDTDDFTGTCNGHRFPLLRAINNALYMRSQGIADRAGANSINSINSISSFFTLMSAVAVLAFSCFRHL